MSVLKVVNCLDPVLRKTARKLTLADFDSKLEELVGDMIDTMYFYQGIGLAAPQVGEPLRVIIANPSQRKGEEIVLLNPVIVEKKGSAVLEEGCLSVPGFSASVRRAKWISVLAKDRNRKDVKIDTEGILARILQHEIDHINGKLFIDRINLLKRAKIIRDFKRTIKRDTSQFFVK